MKKSTLNLKKYLYIIFVLGLSVGFTACDDDEPEANLLLGTWTVNSSTTDVALSNLTVILGGVSVPLSSLGISAQDFEDEFSEELEGEEFIEVGTTMTFNSDNTVVIQVPGESPEQGTYTFSNDILTITDEDITLPFEVTTLTGNSLSMTGGLTEALEEPIDEDGTILRGDITLIIDLELSK